MSVPHEEETVIIQLGELNEFVLKAIQLAKAGYDVAGLSKIDGELSVFVRDVEDVVNLEIDANLKR